MYSYGICFVIILIIFVTLLISNVAVEQCRDAKKRRSGIDELRSLLSSQTQFIKRDCDLETVYSMDDHQCSVICKTSNATFRSKNGVCVNSLIFESAGVENECLPKNGVLAFLVGDSMFGKSKMLCLSIDIGIQPDSIKKPNILCKNGSIDIDYVKSFPQLKDCKCDSDKILAIVESTSVIRTHGVCVSKNVSAPLSYNALLFDKNKI